MKIKVLHIIHSLQVGGLENGVVNLINNLDPDRFEHSICCISTSGPMADRIAYPVKVVTLGKGSGGDHLLSLKLARVITKIRPNIVHTRNWGTIDGVIAARLAGVHRVIHGEHGREATDLTGTNKRRLKIRKLLHPLIARFVTVSTDLKNWLVRDVAVPEAKVVQIINGVDTDRFKPAEDKVVAKVKAGLPPDSFVIGTAGRLDPVKDQQTLVRAFASVRTGSTGLTGKTVLMIIGSGAEEQNLKKLARELGIADKVYFMGERTDVSQLMQAMDVFVLPSVAEGISNTILEAMACGLPVMATGVGGNSELVDGGRTGTIFEAGDNATLARILSSYLGNPQTLSEHGHNAQARVEERFSLARMVEEYDRLYRLVAEV